MGLFLCVNEANKSYFLQFSFGCFVYGPKSYLISTVLFVVVVVYSF